MGTVNVTAETLKKRKKRTKRTKIIVVVLFLFLLSMFFVLMIIYKGGNFTVTLDPNLTLKNDIVLYDTKEKEVAKNKLYAKEIPFMDNITKSWLPDNIDVEKDGDHNGENYIAYTFYVANEGKKATDYWYQINILDVIKNVDEAIRILVYQNGKETLYAKKNELTHKKEKGTTPFVSKDIAALKQRKNMLPNTVDKYTIVVYLEGEDPECVDAIIGGEIKLNMEIREEHVDD